MPPTLLLTRPRAASRRFADALAHLGMCTVISPILRIVPVAHDAQALAAARGLVFTSTHAVPAAGAGRGRPAICVGPATAQAARDAGFDVTEGPGDAAGLAPLLDGLGGLDDLDGGGWWHPHGVHVAARLPVRGMVVYDQQALPLTAEARALLSGAAPVILPIFSARSARLLADAAEGARAPLWIAPISAAAGVCWTVDAARMAVALRPDPAGVLAAVETLVASEQSR